MYHSYTHTLPRCLREFPALDKTMFHTKRFTYFLMFLLDTHTHTNTHTHTMH